MGIWLYQCAEVSDPLLQNQSPHFPWTPREFISPEFFLNFFLNLYSPPWSHKSFKVPRLLQIHLWVKKLNLFIFNHAPKANLSPRFLSLSSRWMGIAHSSRTAFFEDIFFPGDKGIEDYGVERITEINKSIGHKFW